MIIYPKIVLLFCVKNMTLEEWFFVICSLVIFLGKVIEVVGYTAPPNSDPVEDERPTAGAGSLMCVCKVYHFYSLYKPAIKHLEKLQESISS